MIKKLVDSLSVEFKSPFIKQLNHGRDKHGKIK